MNEVRLGTSGWSYKEWVGPFYPDNETKMLSFYSQVFNTAEIDSTFYAYPSKSMVYGWLRYSSKGFVFSAKLPQEITHKKMLDVKLGVKADLNNFAELMEPLQNSGKLFALLIQLPPSFRQNLDLLERFFKVLPEEYRFAIEFRHKSWWNEETWKLLRQYKVSNTIVDEPLLPPETIVTADFAYIRWHGRGRRTWYDYRYSLDELKSWIPKVQDVSEKTRLVYGYFNNHYHGYAVENCLQVFEMLGISSLQQSKTKERIEQYLDQKIAEHKSKQTQLFPQTNENVKQNTSVEGLLLRLMDRGRLQRASEISDDELVFEEYKSNLIRARIRRYPVT
ncbi:MAG: hypothetical protein QG670_43, partial [Thermoproteota archaeon]|nr:hypothetical protein [Thermoproteota archaeon]